MNDSIYVIKKKYKSVRVMLADFDTITLLYAHFDATSLVLCAHKLLKPTAKIRFDRMNNKIILLLFPQSHLPIYLHIPLFLFQQDAYILAF